MAKARLFFSARTWETIKVAPKEEFGNLPQLAHAYGLETPIQIFVCSMEVPAPGPVAQLHDDLTLEIL